MKRLYADYGDRKFQILCFPCNQFGGQEPWEHSKINEFVRNDHGAEYVFFEKVDVNGDNTHPIYTWLKTAFPGGGDITWNFATKFLIGPDGIPIVRWNKDIGWKEINAIISAEVDKNCPLPDTATPAPQEEAKL